MALGLPNPKDLYYDDPDDIEALLTSLFSSLTLVPSLFSLPYTFKIHQTSFNPESSTAVFR